jgi:hypothetical protein
MAGKTEPGKPPAVVRVIEPEHPVNLRKPHLGSDAGRWPLEAAGGRVMADSEPARPGI